MILSRPGQANHGAGDGTSLFSGRFILLVGALTAGLVVVLRATAIGPAGSAVEAIRGASPSVNGSWASSLRPLFGRERPPASATESGLLRAASAAARSEGPAAGLTRSNGDGGLAEGPAAAAAAAAPAPISVVGIAHRGASAELPEHTREAYELAVTEGADFIECDVVLTRDLVPLCRHEPDLLASTDAAAKFPARRRTYTIDGREVEGIFSVDLTAEEVATLRAVQPWPFRNQSYNGMYRVAMLTDYLEVARSAGRPVGIYPETKHPSWTNSLPPLRAANTSVEDILLAALAAAGFGAPLGSAAWRARPVWLQSFEAGSLRYLAGRTCAPAVLLLGDWEGWVAPDSGLSLSQLTSESSLEEISRWAAAVGPDKGTLVTWHPGPAGNGGAEGEGKAAGGGASQRLLQGGGGGQYVSSGLLEKFRAHGLQVHTYTLRPEPRFFLPHLRNRDGDPAEEEDEAGEGVAAEYDLLAGGGAVTVDGVFTDYMPSFRGWMQRRSSSNSSGSSSGSSGWQRPGQRAERGGGRREAREREDELLRGAARGARGEGDEVAAARHGETGGGEEERSGRGSEAARLGAWNRGGRGGRAIAEAAHGGVRRSSGSEGGVQLVAGSSGDVRRGWMPAGGRRVWSDQLRCHVYEPPAAGG